MTTLSCGIATRGIRSGFVTTRQSSTIHRNAEEPRRIPLDPRGSSPIESGRGRPGGALPSGLCSALSCTDLPTAALSFPGSSLNDAPPLRSARRSPGNIKLTATPRATQVPQSWRQLNQYFLEIPAAAAVRPVQLCACICRQIPASSQRPRIRRLASKRTTPTVTDTFSEVTAPYIGTASSTSHRSRTSRRRPRPSPPNTRAVGPSKS